MSDQEFTQFPQMLTAKVRRADGTVRIAPVMRDGQPVIFNNAQELKNYNGTGTPHDGRPEQHSQQSPNYHAYYKI